MPLTASVDTVTGTAGTDTINATETTLTGLDKVDGGAGSDTLNIVDGTARASTSLFVPAGVSVQNVETLNISTNQNIGDGNLNSAFDISGFTGLTTANLVAGANGRSSLVKAADTTDVNVTTTNDFYVVGGKSVTLTDTSKTAALQAYSGNVASVTIVGGDDLYVDDYSVTTTTANDTSAGTLTNVSITGTADAGVTLWGKALTTVTIKSQTTAIDVTVDNTGAAADLDMTLNVENAGKSTEVVELTAALAKSLTINASGTANTVKIDGDASLKAVTVTGAGALTLDVDGAGNTAVASINASASTGNLTLSNIPAAAVSVKTGSGKDAFTLTATAKATVESGAGDDTVTLGSALAAGSTVNLGEGSDKLLSNSGSVAASTAASGATPAAITTIDAGAGTDLLAASLVNAGNGGQFVNFETLGLTNSTVDVSLLTASTITALELIAGGGTYSNITTAQALTAATTTSGETTLTFSGVTGTTDSYNINFALDNSAANTAPTSANMDAGTIVTAGVETYNLASGGSKAWNAITLGINDSAKTVVISGASNLDLAFGNAGTAGSFGSTTTPNTGVSLIDGSAATGKLAINTTDVTAATAGLTIKGGSADDSITLAQKATVEAGAGKDVITVAAAGGTLTGGDGADTFNVEAAVATGTTAATAVLTTITDLAAGDKIDFASTSSGAFTATKVTLGAGVTTLDSAMADAIGGVNTTKWFQYGGNTYIISNDADAAFDAGDTVVKIAGLVDLSASTMTSTVLTIA
jgi:hypothetical protein